MRFRKFARWLRSGERLKCAASCVGEPAIALSEAGHLPSEKIRCTTVEGVVDSSAGHLVIPESAKTELGLDEVWRAKIRYADGHTAERPVVKNICLRVCDRDSVFSAVVEPNRDTALTGAIVLERLDLLVDCVTQTLHPRDPNVIVTEIE